MEVNNGKWPKEVGERRVEEEKDEEELWCCVV
jgi:hypothetical protein